MDYSFFDDDLETLTEANIDFAFDACNTAEYDLDELTIIDSLPTNDNEGEPCHMSLLSIHATSDRADYEKPFFLNTMGFSTIVEGGTLYNSIWGIK